MYTKNIKVSLPQFQNNKSNNKYNYTITTFMWWPFKYTNVEYSLYYCKFELFYQPVKIPFKCHYVNVINKIFSYTIPINLMFCII